MSYFVTGATGFIGRNLVERLLDSGLSREELGRRLERHEVLRQILRSVERGPRAVEEVDLLDAVPGGLARHRAGGHALLRDEARRAAEPGSGSGQGRRAGGQPREERRPRRFVVGQAAHSPFGRWHVEHDDVVGVR